MLNNDLQLRQATDEDKEFLFRLANEKSVRQNSFSDKPIKWDEHVAWFERAMINPDVYIFVLESGENKVGQIRFQIEDKCAQISYSVCEENRGKGYGSRIISMGERSLLEINSEIISFEAFVKSDNIASQKVFMKNGYAKKMQGNVLVYEKQIIS